MTNVLVTGGAGFIGSNFVRYALRTHPEWHITTLDKLTYCGRLENLQDVMDSPRHTFVKGDIRDAAISAPLVEAADIVVHFAPETHVDRSLQNADEFILADVLGTFVLLDAARQAFADGLAATVEWYRANPWWWGPVKHRGPAFQAYYQAQHTVQGSV